MIVHLAHVSGLSVKLIADVSLFECDFDGIKYLNKISI